MARFGRRQRTRDRARSSFIHSLTHSLIHSSIQSSVRSSRPQPILAIPKSSPTEADNPSLASLKSVHVSSRHPPSPRPGHAAAPQSGGDGGGGGSGSGGGGGNVYGTLRPQISERREAPTSRRAAARCRRALQSFRPQGLYARSGAPRAAARSVSSDGS